MNHSQALGRRGEEIVAARLAREGIRVLERNYACPAGELDIVALREDALIFVEVKTRIGDASLCQALGWPQIRRIRRMARRYLGDRGFWERDYRFWVVYVILSHPRDPRPRVIRIEEPF